MKTIFITSPGLNNQNVLPTLSNQLFSFYFTHPNTNFYLLKRFSNVLNGLKRHSNHEHSLSEPQHKNMSNSEFYEQDKEIVRYDDNLDSSQPRELKNALTKELLTKCILEVPPDLLLTTVSVYCVAIPTLIYEKLLHNTKMHTPKIIDTPEEILSMEGIDTMERNELVAYYFNLAQVPFTIPLKQVHILGMINCKFQANENAENYIVEYSLIKQDLEKTLWQDLKINFSEQQITAKKIALERAMSCFKLAFYKDNRVANSLSELHNQLFDFQSFGYLRELPRVPKENKQISSKPVVTDYFHFTKDYDLYQAKDNESYTDISIRCSL